MSCLEQEGVREAGVGSDNVGRFRGSKASRLFASQLAHPTVGGLITGHGCLVGACLQQQLHSKKA
jgi:hypothetical protein